MDILFQIVQNGGHIAGVCQDENMEKFADSTKKFKKLRIQIHSSGTSDNHITILLLVPHGKSIEIDMRALMIGFEAGHLVWSERNSQLSETTIAHRDCELASEMTVEDMYHYIRTVWRMHRYLFPTGGGGSGGHFWNYSLVEFMVAYEMLHPGYKQYIKQFLSYKYIQTPNVSPTHIQMVEGKFCTEDEWLMQEAHELLPAQEEEENEEDDDEAEDEEEDSDEDDED